MEKAGEQKASEILFDLGLKTDEKSMEVRPPGLRIPRSNVGVSGTHSPPLLTIEFSLLFCIVSSSRPSIFVLM
ncbi:hypothetical protein V6N13_087625 [Hibiscus sabdariffa]|uniref:Uncharacterized protein n=1 Tax=Hibiscus sabdariffa TaxID=183260 RepID=A0ABR2FWW8_9ROSI